MLCIFRHSNLQTLCYYIISGIGENERHRNKETGVVFRITLDDCIQQRGTANHGWKFGHGFHFHEYSKQPEVHQLSSY